MRKIASVLSAAVLTLTLCACSSGSSTSSITVAGSTTCLPIAEIAAEGFKEETGTDVLVSGLGSSAGIEAVSAGTADIASSSRGLNADEQDLGLTPIVIAHDGIAVIVNDDNPVDNLSTEQLRDIYAGKITNWKELGGTDAPITLYTREDGSGTREVFVERALNKGSIVQSANVVNSNGAMKTAVAQDKQSIGYVGIGHVDKNVKALVFDKMVPSQENASNGTYKVTRLLFMNTKGAPEGITKAFIDYIYTPEGTEIIKKSGYIPTGRQ